MRHTKESPMCGDAENHKTNNKLFSTGKLLGALRFDFVDEGKVRLGSSDSRKSTVDIG